MNGEFTWKAPEYDDRHKSKDWFGVLTVIGIGGGILSIILGNVLLAILIIVATVALLLEGLRQPRVVVFGLDKHGARAGSVIYPYKDLSSFWIETEDTPTKLLMKSGKTLMPLIVFPLPSNIDLDELHTFLNERLEEEPLAEPFFERVFRYFGF